MADINVFELTNKELHKTDASKSATPTKKVTKKSVRESIARKSRKARPFRIPANKLKLESVAWYQLHEDDNEGEEVTADYTPNDDVVLVIDPEMDEVPEDLEAAEEQAEELIGDHVCKCSICGANYVTDAEITEDMDMEDETCPVCGETGEQIVVGVITPTEEISTEDEEEVEDTEDITDGEAEGEIEISDEEEEDFGDEDFNFDEEEEEEEDEDDDFEESIKRSRARTLRRKAESVRRNRMRGRKLESARRPMTAKRPMKAVKAVKESTSAVDFDDVTFNRMLTRFAKENYENVKFVRISNGSLRGKKLTLEGVVTTTKGSKRPIKFVSENFEMGKRMTIKFKEYGPFTESVKNTRPSFVVECVLRGTTIIPAALSYNFKAKDQRKNSLKRESVATYSVTGKVLSESIRKPSRVSKKRRNK